MDLVTAWVSFVYLYSLFAWILAFGLATMWVYSFVVLDSWMGSMKSKPTPPTVYVNGNSHLVR